MPKQTGKRKQKELVDEHADELSSSPNKGEGSGTEASDAAASPTKVPACASSDAKSPKTPVKSPTRQLPHSPGSSKSRRNLELLRSNSKQRRKPASKPKPHDSAGTRVDEPNGNQGGPKSKCQTKLFSCSETCQLAMLAVNLSLCASNVIRCCHCHAAFVIAAMVKRGRTFACKPCNSARQAVVKEYKRCGQSHIWKKMGEAEQNGEIQRNRGNNQGRGKRFPVEIREKVLSLASRSAFRNM